MPTEEHTPSVQTTASSGWNCASCGALVSWGQAHACNSTPSVYTNNAVLERIATALEKIADALGK